MAERRMFAKTIIDSDAFLDMPATTQLLYFHLSMRADDDGFINNPKKIQRMVGCSDDDLKLLLAKQFILAFESGVIVIKHWKIHNYIRSDRYKPTVYEEEKAMLQTKENNAYTFGIPNDNQMDTNGIPSVNQTVDNWDTQVRLGKVRLGKDRGETTTAEQNDLSTVSEIIQRQWKRKAEESDIEHALKQLERLNGDTAMLSDALEIAAQHGERAKNWKYTTAIIDSWIRKGYTCEEDVLMNELHRKGGI